MIVVLGHHRSGTSLVAGLLHHAGVDMGDTLLRADENNKYGYYEEVELVQFNERLLTLLGYKWQQGTPVHYIPDYTFEEARHLLHGKTEPWGWKDPRLVMLWDLWKTVLPERLVIITQRRKEHVIQSLMRRKAFPMTKTEATLLYERTQWQLAHIASTEEVIYAPYERLLKRHGQLQFQEKLNQHVDIELDFSFVDQTCNHAYGPHQNVRTS